MSANKVESFFFRRMDAMIEMRKGLDAYALRQKVQAANIANSETPGYTARKVAFEDELTKALDRRGSAMVRSHSSHVPVMGGLKSLDRVTPEIHLSDEPNLNGVNNVNIDTEMSDMATNQIMFAMTSKLLATRYKMLKSAILGRMM